MAGQLWVMVTAMILSVALMLVFAGKIGDFVERHPTVKILALAFLLLIGVILVAEGLGQHISKGYIYFAMAFALAGELLNMRFRKVHKPVQLHGGTPERAVGARGGTDRAGPLGSASAGQPGGRGCLTETGIVAVRVS